MRSTEPTVYLIWVFGTLKEQITEMDCPILRAIDLKYELAQKHKTFLEQKGFKAVIESCSANHLFAQDCLGTLERIEKREAERKTRGFNLAKI